MTSFVSDERGSVAIEYALIAALIGLVIVTAVGDIGTAVLAMFNKIHF